MHPLTLESLNKEIINCNKCTRLVNFRKRISKNKRKEYVDEDYWGRPITGFGDKKGKILKTWNDVKVKDHAKEVLETLKNLSKK